MRWETTVGQMVWTAVDCDGATFVVNTGPVTVETGAGGGTEMPAGTAGQVPQVSSGSAYVLKTPNTADGLVRLDGDATIPDILIPSSIARDSEVAAAVDDLSGVSDKATARTNLELGTAAVAALLDEDDMASNDATAVPSQQSVKAYVDANAPYGWRQYVGAQAQVIDTSDTTDVLDSPITLPGIVPGEFYEFEAAFDWFNNSGAIRDTELYLVLGSTTVCSVRIGRNSSLPVALQQVVRGTIGTTGAGAAYARLVTGFIATPSGLNGGAHGLAAEAIEGAAVNFTLRADHSTASVNMWTQLIHMDIWKVAR